MGSRGFSLNLPQAVKNNNAAIKKFWQNEFVFIIKYFIPGLFILNLCTFYSFLLNIDNLGGYDKGFLTQKLI